MNKYIEHIINDLIRDTRMDYDKERIYFPHTPSRLYYSTHLPPTFSPPHRSVFYSYCKERYGLTEEEIGYVWDQYKSIIKDKISKRES